MKVRQPDGIKTHYTRDDGVPRILGTYSFSVKGTLLGLKDCTTVVGVKHGEMEPYFSFCTVQQQKGSGTPAVRSVEVITCFFFYSYRGTHPNEKYVPIL